MKTTRQTAKASIYQTVTDRILASLKAGVIPWEQHGTLRVLGKARSLAISAPGNRTAE